MDSVKAAVRNKVRDSFAFRGSTLLIITAALYKVVTVILALLNPHCLDLEDLRVSI